MDGIRFEWDETKNRSNLRKHGISFEEASRVFLDPLYVSLKEREENGEQRWQTFGMVNEAMLLMVAHTVQELQGEENIDVIRIITARRAESQERRRYEDENS